MMINLISSEVTDDAGRMTQLEYYFRHWDMLFLPDSAHAFSKA